MKKNRALRLGAIILAITLVTCCLLSSTLAKYTSSFYGEDTARVAKFSFASGTLGTQGAAIDLFSTAFDDQVLGTDPENLGIDGKKLIAPGTAGSLAIDLAGEAEVDVSMIFTFAETQENDIPLFYSIGVANEYYSNELAEGTYYFVLPEGGNTKSEVTIVGNVADMAAAASSATIEAGADYAAEEFTISWFWAFEQYTRTGEPEAYVYTLDAGYDAANTALGNAAVEADLEVAFAVSVTVTQLD